MLFSVIIPASEVKYPELKKCIASISNAAAYNLQRGHATEVIVSYPDNEPPPPKSLVQNMFVRYVPHSTTHDFKLAPGEPSPYWKAKALNTGLDCSNGDVLVFLDADSLVNGFSLATLDFLLRPRKTGLKFKDAKKKKMKRMPMVSTKAAYRVKYISPDQVVIGNQLELWNTSPMAFEGIYKADTDMREYIGEPPIDRRLHFGNSQFAVTRERMGNLRWDENYIGRGFEDIDMNARMSFYHGSEYRCQLITTWFSSIFHIKTPMTKEYAGGRWNDRNRRRYYEESLSWYCCPNASVAESVTVSMLRKHIGNYKVVWTPNDEWELSTVNKELDTIYNVMEDGTMVDRVS